MPKTILTNEFLSSIPAAIAGSSTWLAAATHAPTICPIMASVTPTPATAVTDLVISGNGVDPQPGVVGSQDVGYDPVKLQYYVEISPPVGGFVFQPESMPTEQFVIYGIAILAGATHSLAGIQMFDAPVTFSAGVGSQKLPLDVVRFYVDPLGIG